MKVSNSGYTLPRTYICDDFLAKGLAVNTFVYIQIGTFTQIM